MAKESLFAKVWNDDAGALIPTEYLFVATVTVLGIVVGLTGVRNAITAELSQLSNAFLSLSQGYTISGVSGCSTSIDNTQAIDTPGIVTNPTPTRPANPSKIDVPAI